mgnify:FL=1
MRYEVLNRVGDGWKDTGEWDKVEGYTKENAIVWPGGIKKLRFLALLELCLFRHVWAPTSERRNNRNAT